MEKNQLDIFKNYTHQIQIKEVLDCNDYPVRFGLSLTELQAKALVQIKSEVLKEEERLEFETGVIDKIIFAFCDSAFITPDNYMDTLCNLVQMFYRYKNETLGVLSDDELIETMRYGYEEICEGDLEFLDDTVLEKLAREARGCEVEEDE